jgi:hypothetical protein
MSLCQAGVTFLPYTNLAYSGTALFFALRHDPLHLTSTTYAVTRSGEANCTEAFHHSFPRPTPIEKESLPIIISLKRISMVATRRSQSPNAKTTTKPEYQVGDKVEVSTTSERRLLSASATLVSLFCILSHKSLHHYSKIWPRQYKLTKHSLPFDPLLGAS